MPIKTEIKQSVNSNVERSSVGDISITASSLQIEPIEEDTWLFFDREKFDSSPNSKIVPLSKLTWTKIQLPIPDVINRENLHPAKRAYNYFLRRINADPLVRPRAPITVTANTNGSFHIVDGYATAQAAIFVGWRSIPVIIIESPIDYL